MVKIWGAILAIPACFDSIYFLIAAIIFDESLLGKFIKFFGLILQILGLCTVIRDVSGRQKLFNYPHILNEIKSWWQTCPFLTQNKTISIVANGVVVSGVGNPTISKTARLAATIEERLSILEKNYNSLIKDCQKNKRTSL